jgi:thiol-disulfide isomerase/thioredoxin
MQKLLFVARLITRRLGLVLAIGLLCAVPLAGTAAESLKELDTRADGSRVLNMVVHREARAVPAFKFADVEGNYLSLENFRGKIVALHFWATWCIPCRKELPTVDALQNQLGGADFTFVPLSVDRDGADLVRRYYADHGIQHLPVYIDERMNAAQAMLVNGIPYTILINREGMEIARILGDRNWTAPDSIALMRKIIE